MVSHPEAMYGREPLKVAAERKRAAGSQTEQPLKDAVAARGKTQPDGVIKATK
jgi:hypothetical protein